MESQPILDFTPTKLKNTNSPEKIRILGEEGKPEIKRKMEKLSHPILIKISG
jgi:hypothetical protein